MGSEIPTSGADAAPEQRGWRGEIDGALGLIVDNAIQLILALSLLAHVGLPRTMVVGLILPAMVVTIVIGALVMAAMARRQAGATALPYGTSTVSMIAFVYLVMVPVRDRAVASGADPSDAAMLCLGAALAAALTLAVFVAALAPLMGPLAKHLPAWVLLGPLVGIGLCFLGADMWARASTFPVVALPAAAMWFAVQQARIRLPIPTALAAALVGATLAWVTFAAGWPSPVSTAGVAAATSDLQLALPGQALALLWNGFGELGATQYGTVFFLAVSNALGSTQNIAVAKSDGDIYPTVKTLLMSAGASAVGTGLGSPFPGTIYVGHGAWKRLGSTAAYAEITAGALAVLVFSGSVSLAAAVVPLEALLPVLVWIGLAVMQQGFTLAGPTRVWVVGLGILPLMAAWARTFITEPTTPLHHGVVALGSGALLIAMVWSVWGWLISERRFNGAALTFGIAAAASALRMMHGGAVGWSAGYLGASVVCLVLGRIAKP